jgi:hypothetical protein
MKITKSQLTKIIKEELALVKEEDGPFGNRSYDHSLVSNVSKTIQWEIDQAFNFVLDLLEDVNAHAEYKIVKKVLWDSLEDAGGDEAHADVAAQQKGMGLTPGVGGVPPADDPRRDKVKRMEEKEQKR